MKSRFQIASTVLFVGMLFLSIPISTYAAGGKVAPQDLISLGQGLQTGVWMGNNVTVDYKLSRGQSGIDLSGVARFNDNIAMNFSVLRDFHLRAVFTDAGGRIIGSQGLATNRGNFDPTPFRAKLTPPPGTADIAFGYEGTALGGGDEGAGGGPTRFWQYVG